MDDARTGRREPASAWFFRLDLPDRVQLLAEPEAPVPARLVRALGADGEQVLAVRDPGGPRPVPYLSGEAAAQLTRRRDELLVWWKGLAAERRQFLLAHRDSWLPESYREIVAASGTLLTRVHRDETGTGWRVLLTPMMRTFLEWQARTVDTGD